MLKQISRFFLLCFLLSLVPSSAGAQDSARADLFPPNTDQFPIISAYLDVYDSAGNFAHNLSTQNLKIIEDGATLPISELTELQNGAQFTVAINIGPAYAIQDSNGISRYEQIQQTLNSWLEDHPLQANDDLSLLTNDGVQISHADDPDAWLSTFNSYEPNFDTAIPSLDVLASAITTTVDAVTLPVKSRGVLLITPLPNEDSLAALPSLASIAQQEQVRVNIWMVSSRAYFESPGAVQLADLAAQTGGQLFLFSGDEILPPVDPYVEQLRYTYFLKYQSKISSGESHQIAAQIETPSLTTTSEAVGVNLSVQPPNPIFISPPLEVIRSPGVNEEIRTEQAYELLPREHPLEILIEFPDGYNRQLDRTTLIVDGEVVAENSSEPFHLFSWNLNDFVSEGSHIIQVEAIDELGLRGTSIEHQVAISIQQTPVSLVHTLRQNIGLITGIVAAIILCILMVVLIIGGKIQPKTTGRLSWRKESRPKEAEFQSQRQNLQPSSQTNRPPKDRLSNLVNRFTRPMRRDVTQEGAYLEIITVENGNHQKDRIPISQSELTFGCDATQATIEFVDPSLDELHARLLKSGNDNYVIADEGSRAGTWVNYTPVSSEGVTLSHGDIIHIGRIQLQFKLNEINKVPKPKIIPQELF